MGQYIYPMFKKAKAEIGATFCSTSVGSVSAISSTLYGQNFSITLQVLTGDIHISALSTAPTTAFPKFIAGDSIDLMVEDKLSLVSTSTTASYQAFIWER